MNPGCWTMKAELDGTTYCSDVLTGTYGERCSNVHISTKSERLVTRVRPHPIRFRYRTGPRVLDDGALWQQTEHAPQRRRPVKGQR